MKDYQTIARAIEYLQDNQRQQPSLDEVAEHVGLSPFHFQRLFVRWAGTTPKKFLQCLTVEAAKRQLLAGQSVLDAALDVGLSGPSRLHDLTVSLEAASPGEIKSGGQGWTISAGLAETPFGQCFMAESPRGICRIEFCDGSREPPIENLQSDWPEARMQVNDRRANELAKAVFCREAVAPTARGQAVSLRCLVKGTEFQTRVWRALLQIPRGHLTTYSQIARSLGKPKAARAVGSAVATNSIGVLIPCHRVIRGTGVVGEYRWGTVRKRALIGAEICHPPIDLNK